jgi:hypothetical protein
MSSRCRNGQPDLTFENLGSIWMVKPHTPTGRHWFAQYLYQDGREEGMIVDEEADDIFNAACQDGLHVAII